jgi:hypothetical protein
MRTCSGEGQQWQRLSVLGMGWIVVGLRRGGTRDVALDSGLSGMGQWGEPAAVAVCDAVRGVWPDPPRRRAGLMP